jgi:hypothetical protein
MPKDNMVNMSFLSRKDLIEKLFSSPPLFYTSGPLKKYPFML